MSFYKRSDMIYNYSWSADGGDNPKLKGEPDDSLFDRTEGYEVLYLINRFGEATGRTTITDGNKAERLINDKLPGDVRSQVRVKNWLEENW
jgi:hypothetical protein